MNPEQIDAIRQQLAEFLKICKCSQRQAARELGVSITTLVTTPISRRKPSNLSVWAQPGRKSYRFPISA